MNEPVVTQLFYDLKLSSELAFNNPPPLEQELCDFKFILQAGQLEVTMKREVQTEKDARNIVDPYLRSWELDHFLTTGRKEFWFHFKNSIIVDKKPTRPGDIVIHVGVAELIVLGEEVTWTLTKKNYPNPNFSLSITPDVETLISRYEDFTKKKEPLLSMAYFCLTVLEASGGNLKSASLKYNIHKDALKKLSELTSTRGNMTESRKAKGRTAFEPLTTKEIDWINATVRILIRRKAEYEHEPTGSFCLIDLAALPSL